MSKERSSENMHKEISGTDTYKSEKKENVSDVRKLKAEKDKPSSADSRKRGDK